MPAKMSTVFCRFNGSACELSNRLFGVDPIAVLGGSPIACADPVPGSVVDVSLPTFAGVNPQRIKARAYIQDMRRIMGEEGACIFAVRGDVQCVADGLLDPAPYLALEESFLPVLCRQNDNAATIAHYLRSHPRVAEVDYPGFKDAPRFDMAAQMLVHGFGNVIDYLCEDMGEAARIAVSEDDPFDQIDRLEALLGI